MEAKTPLKRHLGLVALLFYGIGDILGAGIYALIGPASAAAGSHLWVSFAIALAVALLTALGYSEMTSRFPKSGGVSHFADVAFDRPVVSFMAGWLLLFVSIVSMATLTRAFSGYFSKLGVDIPAPIVMPLFLIAVGLVNFHGIKNSSIANIISTSIEATGLLVVIVAGFAILGGTDRPEVAATPFDWSGVLKGAALAFYAFIGFEDLANVAEESIRPKKNLPRAILGSLGVAGSIYITIGALSTTTVGANDLAGSSAPLALLVSRSGLPIPTALFAVIALFAVLNTCLLNSITGSRLLYGLAEQNLVPRFFSAVNPTRQTPHFSIVAVILAAGVLSAFSSLGVLAGATSVLILIVFCTTNLALLKVKRTMKRDPEAFRVPAWIAVVAIVANVGLLTASSLKSIGIAVAIAALGFIIHFAMVTFARSRTETFGESR